jgi:hypothetical protein
MMMVVMMVSFDVWRSATKYHVPNILIFISLDIVEI